MPLWTPSSSGVLAGVASTGTDWSKTGTTPADITSMSLTYTPVGRPITIRFSGNGYSVAGATMWLELVATSTTLVKQSFYLPPGAPMPVDLEHTYTPSPGSAITFKAVGYLNGGGETAQISVSSAGVGPHQLTIRVG